MNRLLRLFHGDEVQRVIREIARLGGTVARNPATDLLTINSEFAVSVVVARCRETSTGGLRWKVCFDTGLVPDINIAILIKQARAEHHGDDRCELHHAVWKQKVGKSEPTLPALPVRPRAILAGRLRDAAQ